MIGGAIAILVVGVFWMDVFGYDSYIPDEKETLDAGGFVSVRLIELYEDGCLAEITGKRR